MDTVFTQGQLEDRYALLDALYAQAPIGLAFVDVDLRYVRINAVLAAINGRPVADHLGRTIGEVLGDLGSEVADAVRRVIESGEPSGAIGVTGETVAAPGETRAWRVSLYPVADAAGRIRGVGHVVLETTQERRAAAEAQAASRRLDELRRRLLDREHEGRLAAEAARARAELVAAAGRALAASLDWEQTVRTAVDVAVPAVADLCSLHLVAPGRRIELAAVAAHDPATEALARDLAERFAPRWEDTTGIAGVIHSGVAESAFGLEPAVVDDLAYSPEHEERLRALSPRSVIVAPVSAGGTPFGALSFVYTSSGRRYSEEDVLLADALADRIALALENARLHTERSRIARTLQQSLLPPALPQVPGIEAAAAYFPAGDENEVGGDFYDLFESEPGIWTVLVGDVAGKGAEAAALTALARYTLRTASMLDSSPMHNLRLLNEALLAREAGTCTVLYARLAPGRGRALMTAAAAGHPPPFVLRRDGALEELTPPGTLLGAVDAPRLQSREVELEAGDLVLFYTDGATDVRVPSGVLGERVLRAVLGGCAGCGAEQVVALVADSVRAAQGGHLDDDLALLALRVCG